MAYQHLLYEVKGPVATLTMNRPEKLNAMNLTLQREIVAAMHEAEDDPSVRVILLRGSGRAFSSGYDVAPSDPSEAQHRRTDNIREDIQRLRGVGARWAEIWNLSKPVIAVVHGYCLAGGTDLAQHCDLIIAAEDATFGFPAVRAMGSPPTHMWVYNLGPQWAKYLLLTGDSIDGRTAERLGLVFKAVPAADLDREARELAGRIAKTPWELLAANKGIVNRALELMGRGLLQQLAAETDAIAHRAPVAHEFNCIADERGLKAALEWRDGPFREDAG
ncbi:MAG: crotonase/enoyl-CoA hydratase family protein [Dehalococcoidia bacterium]|nr:crotonase/enoyl-CoA hydratase family protein [Dehalococcoidia bacterium]